MSGNGVDGVAAAHTLLARGDCAPGLCLYYVWFAYREHGARVNETYPDALAAWNGSPGKHYDRNPPAGVPVYFGAKPGSAAGDVVISMGNGQVAATDWPRYGVIGQTTIIERQAQINRPYLGWTDNILGFPISQMQNDEPAPEPIPVLPEDEDDDMRPITILRVDPQSKGVIEGCRLHPDIGTDLPQFVDEFHSRTNGSVTTFRGGMVSNDWDGVVAGWRATDIKGGDYENVDTYIAAQREWSRFVVEISGKIPEGQDPKPPKA
jgi:hypothetical protein